MMLTRLVGAMDPAAVVSDVVSMTGRGALSDAIEASGVTVHALDMRNGRPTLPHLAALASLLRRLQIGRAHV